MEIFSSNGTEYNLTKLEKKKDRWVMKRAGVTKEEKPTFYLSNRIHKQKPIAPQRLGKTQMAYGVFYHQDRKQPVCQHVKNSAEVLIWLVSISLYQLHKPHFHTDNMKKDTNFSKGWH